MLIRIYPFLIQAVQFFRCELILSSSFLVSISLSIKFFPGCENHLYPDVLTADREEYFPCDILSNWARCFEGHQRYLREESLTDRAADCSTQGHPKFHPAMEEVMLTPSPFMNVSCLLVNVNVWTFMCSRLCVCPSLGVTRHMWKRHTTWMIDETCFTSASSGWCLFTMTNVTVIDFRMYVVSVTTTSPQMCDIPDILNTLLRRNGIILSAI